MLRLTEELIKLIDERSSLTVEEIKEIARNFVRAQEVRKQKYPEMKSWVK